MCDDFLISFHKKDIIDILQEEDTSEHFSININFIVLYEHQPNVVVELLKEPEKCLEEWDRATIRVQMALIKEADGYSQLKNNVHCRIYHLPGLSEVRRTVFPGNEDAGKFLQVSGTVLRMSVAKLLEYQRSYVCIKCKYSTLVKAEYDRKYIIKQPKKCQNPEDCSGTNLVSFGELDSDYCKDFQEIKVQEQTNKLGVGSMPNTMWVTLEDDLVDSCKPGDNVTICGIVKRRWGEFSKGSKIDIDIVLKANNVQVDNNSSSIAASTPEVKEMFNAFWEKYSGNPLSGRDLILKSFCPQIYGLYFVKLAIAVVLAGGSQTGDPTLTGVRTRSESHLLLVGDPGTGKSQLLRFASKIIPRSVLTTGVGSTAAGLTVTALMEHGEWQLEGGALVMADGGICCIDEFNSMKEHDRTSIHEAMEQQTISVAKASIVCKLNTRCSVLAACNPKGNLDVMQPLCMNIALPSPLLSRFDLILLLRDAVNEEWDTQVTDYILNGGYNFSKLTNNGLWNVDTLQSYFMIIRKLNPKLSEDAEIILSTYYQLQRRIESRNKARTTVRLLESLVRLSQGHARLMFHEEVETVDSIYAIILVDVAMDSDSQILNLNVNTHSTFPEWPSRDYRAMLEAVLTKLQLHEILEKEVAILDERRKTEHSENLRSRFFNAPYVLENNRIDDLNERKENFDEPSTDTTSVNDAEGSASKRKIRSVEDDHNIVKKVRKITDDINLDLDEGYDTVLIHNQETSRNSPNREPIHKPSSSKKVKNFNTTNATKCDLTENNRRKGLPYTKTVEEVSNATICINKTTDNPLDFDFDDGYDTVSFSNSHSSKNNTAALPTSQQENLSAKPKINQDVKQSKQGNVSNLIKSELITDKSVLPNAENPAGPLEKCTETVKPSSVKNKLKKFKFVPKNDADILPERLISGSSKDNADLDDKTVNKNENQNNKIAVGKRNSANGFTEFMTEDLQVLKCMSNNDDFNIDLDFDWDTVGSASENCVRNDENDNPKNKISELNGLSQNSKLKWIHNKFSSKSKLVKKLSDCTSSSSVIRSNSGSSSASYTKMFQTSEEDINDLDLDI